MYVVESIVHGMRLLFGVYPQAKPMQNDKIEGLGAQLTPGLEIISQTYWRPWSSVGSGSRIHKPNRFRLIGLEAMEIGWLQVSNSQGKLIMTDRFEGLGARLGPSLEFISQ